MTTVKQIQAEILEQTGIKTSVKKLKGSMKNYICFSPMFQNGLYPEFDFQWRIEYMKKFETVGQDTNSCNGTQMCILLINFNDLEPEQYKKERKPTKFEDLKVRSWGSKNSQFRLDKNAERYAKKLSRPNSTNARYY